MKKILYLIAALAMISMAVSCSDDDEPKRGDGVFTVNTPMVNHMVNMSNGQVLGVTSTRNKLTFDTAKHTASLELHYLVGTTEKTLTLDGITAKPIRLGYYELSGRNDLNFSGYVDLFEGPSMRYVYQTPEGILVTSTLPEIFFRKTESIITYDDTTKSNKSESTMYVFTINPDNQTATIEVEDIVHAKDMRDFVNITANSVPYTVTKNGFTISAENLKTTAKYKSHSGSGGSITIAETDKYPFKTFNATIDLSAHQLEDSLSATFMIGGSASVTATGRTYPNY
jgi:hypothetical protein